MKLFFRVAFYLLTISSYAQSSNIFLGQYFKVMPAFAPGLNGANDFLDIRTGSRYQWIGYDGAPKTYFVSGNGAIYLDKHNPYKNNSVRVSNLSPYRTKGVKLGVGGYVFDDQYGAYHQTDAMGSVAIHIPVSSASYLSLGISTGWYHSRIAMSDLFVLNPQNDATYQQYLQSGARSNYIKINTGLALYSHRFYLSYGLMNVAMAHIGGNTFFEAYAPALTHNMLGGVIINIGPYMEWIPNAFVRYTPGVPLVSDTGMRFRFRQNPYLGVSYRNDHTLVSMLGFTLQDQFSFGYSFEFKAMGHAGMNTTSHEIVLGLQLFNHRKYVPIW